jgi:hypothetical protein
LNAYWIQFNAHNNIYSLFKIKLIKPLPIISTFIINFAPKKFKSTSSQARTKALISFNMFKSIIEKKIGKQIKGLKIEMGENSFFLIFRILHTNQTLIFQLLRMSL